MRSALGRAVKTAKGVRWYVRELTDESAYDRHVAHLRANHTDAPVPSRREFRAHADRPAGVGSPAGVPLLLATRF